MRDTNSSSSHISSLTTLASAHCSSPTSEWPIPHDFDNALATRMRYYCTIGGYSLEAHGIAVVGNIQEPPYYPQDPDFPGVRPIPPPRPPTKSGAGAAATKWFVFTVITMC